MFQAFQWKLLRTVCTSSAPVAAVCCVVAFERIQSSMNTIPVETTKSWTAVSIKENKKLNVLPI